MDRDNDALAVYQKNFSPEMVLDGDIAHYIDGALGDAPTVLETLLLEQLGRVDILVAGPPCQGHSNLNNHTRRNDERNGLYSRVARFSEIAKPNWIIIENVASVVHDVRRSLEKTRESLESHHYFCDEETIDLSQIGVPQLRKRHILVASRLSPINIKKVIENHAYPKARNVLWAIEDLSDNVNSNLLNSVRKLSEENYRRIRWLFENDAFDLPNELRPRCHHGEHKYYAMYGRLRPHLPTNTITTGFGSPGQGRYIHPTRPRTLTAHEAARLQFFPDFFDFSPARSYEALARMIGNAVPMKLSYLLTLALLRD
jgi:DNA (cytosine-5)-methyltransferase 1